MRILIAEDERDLNEILEEKLTSEGYGVDVCYDGIQAMEYLQSAEYDAVLLDVMMPGKDGFQVLREMRACGIKSPVLFLTARDSIEDRVQGLDLGADDYLTKPFAFRELMARVRAMIRKGYQTPSSILQVEDLVMDTGAHRVRRADQDIDLSAKEYALLEYLMMNAGQVLSREQIENHIWNFDYEGGTNVVDVYISYLRRKIDEGRDPRLIRTVRGVGYMLAEGAQK